MTITTFETVILAKETGAGPVYSTAQLTIERLSTGQYRFTDSSTGDKFESSDKWADRLFDSIDALV